MSRPYLSIIPRQKFNSTLQAISFVVITTLFVLFAESVFAQTATRMLAMPSVSESSIVFVYDNDLWISDRDGGTARRLTSADGREINPVYSPDESMIAFSADYDGNMDVYVIPASGGPVKRLTWHPGDDVVHGFTPDGESVLFESPRSVYTTRYKHLYTVSAAGGVPERLPVPTGYKAALSPDGQYLAYTPLPEAFNQWKNYRGGRISRIWIMDLSDLSVTEIPKPEGGANDTDPMWIDDSVYFNSDRDGEFNLYSYDTETKSVNRLTNLEDFPVLEPNAHEDGTIVFEHAGYLHELDINTGDVSQLQIAVHSDLEQTRDRFVTGSEWVRNASPSPNMERVVFEYRGEIVTVPAEKGDPRNITSDSGVHNRSPVWSPDGSKVAWFSDKDGEYALFVGNQDGSGELEKIELDGAGFYDQPNWSPDGNYIAYRDNSQSHWVVELESGDQTKIAQEPVYTPLNLMSASWSPDSKWLAYTIQDHGLIRTVYAWSVESDESVRLTDGMSEAASPVFDPNGEYLYVLASTDAGPLKDWFSQASIDMQMNYNVYAITLSQDGPNPLPPQSDEVSVEGSEDEVENEENGEVQVEIDPEGIENRIVSLGLPEANRRNLRVGASGELYWIESSGETSFNAFGTPGELKKYTLVERETKTLTSGVGMFELNKEGNKILYNQGGNWFVTAISDPIPAGKGQLNLDAIQVKLDPLAEWEQIFHEAWRINRDYFYDPNFHGADWPAMREKYEVFLPDLATRYDLFRVIRWMLSELAVGHSYQSMGETPDDPDGNPPGLLGADYEVENNRYRFSKVYGGLNWNPDLRAPLKTTGVNVEAGEYLIAINNEEIRPPQSVYEPFAGLAGKQVSITVADNPEGDYARKLTVVPVSNEVNLRYLDWVVSNQEYVDQQTNGRVAYVHVPNTAGAGHKMFKRYFYPQSHKDALILDERHNGGGLIADYYIEFLRRQYISHWNFRYGDDLISPRGAILGPKVMLADETAGSGGDLLPWMFKKFDIGPVIGKRTWGGLVGILGFPVLRDGATITAPNLAFWTEGEGFAVENEGVQPDIEVEQWPAEVMQGRDPQLDRAIREIQEMLEENPPREYERPDYPERVDP